MKINNNNNNNNNSNNNTTTATKQKKMIFYLEPDLNLLWCFCTQVCVIAHMGVHTALVKAA